MDTQSTVIVIIFTCSVSSLKSFWKCLLMLQFSQSNIHGFICKVSPWAMACNKTTGPVYCQQPCHYLEASRFLYLTSRKWKPQPCLCIPTWFTVAENKAVKQKMKESRKYRNANIEIKCKHWKYRKRLNLKSSTFPEMKCRLCATGYEDFKFCRTLNQQ